MSVDPTRGRRTPEHVDRHGHHHLCSGGAHDQEDPGGHTHGRGLRGVLQGIFRPHSHDSADSIDAALEASDRGIRAVTLSFGVLMVTAVLQVVVVIATGSVALLADTIHNFSDALTAVPLFIAFRLSKRPANRRFTYGYRRAEDLAGVFIVAMIALSAVIAGWQAIDRLLNPRPLDNLAVLFAAGLIGFVGNEAVALFRIREGTSIGSAALVADGYHARTDGFTSLAVALGAAGVGAGFERADPIVGLLISVAIFAVLRGAVVQIYYRLMDAVDPSIVDRVEVVAAATDGVLAVETPRVRWLGHRLEADLTIVVAAGLAADEGHAIADAVVRRLTGGIRHLDDVRIHVHVDHQEELRGTGPDVHVH